MKDWSISQAKAKFTKVIVSSEESPQIICNRGKPVSAVIHIELFKELLALKDKQRKPTVSELLADLKVLQKTDPVEIDIPERRDRPNPLEDTSNEMDL